MIRVRRLARRLFQGTNRNVSHAKKQIPLSAMQKNAQSLTLLWKYYISLTSQTDFIGHVRCLTKIMSQRSMTNVITKHPKSWSKWCTRHHYAKERYTPPQSNLPISEFNCRKGCAVHSLTPNVTNNFSVTHAAKKFSRGIEKYEALLQCFTATLHLTPTILLSVNHLWTIQSISFFQLIFPCFASERNVWDCFQNVKFMVS